MATYEFKLTYDDRKQIARITNVPGKDGYVCGYDIVFMGSKDKRDLKEGLSAIVAQLQKPLSQRGQEDRTPISVVADLRKNEDLEAELAIIKAERDSVKAELEGLKSPPEGVVPNARD